jgi:hypothetical protein
MRPLAGSVVLPPAHEPRGACLWALVGKGQLAADLNAASCNLRFKPRACTTFWLFSKHMKCISSGAFHSTTRYTVTH